MRFDIVCRIYIIYVCIVYHILTFWYYILKAEKFHFLAFCSGCGHIADTCSISADDRAECITTFFVA